MSDEPIPKLPKGFDWRALTPADSPKTLPDMLADPVHRDLATPKLAEGDLAFDDPTTREGRIAFPGEQGPFGFRPADLEQAIERELARLE